MGSGNGKFLGTILPNGNILLANQKGLYELNATTLGIERHHPITQIAHSFENIFVSSEGEIFLLTGVNGIVYYFTDFASPPRILKNTYTTNIFQLVEMNGQVLGGSNAGFVSFNGDDFELLEESGCGIWSLLPDGDKLWVGTNCGIGLVRDGRFSQMELTTFDRELMVKSMLPARSRKHLWLGTNKGFSYFNTETSKFEFTINTKDGLSGDEITPGGLLMDHHNLLWVGTYHGISNFNIKARSTRNIAPVCYIEKMLLNGEPIEAEKGRVFAHNENSLVFEISALSYADEASLEYEYYLRGKGNAYASYHRGSEYRAVYNNLPSGNYDFIYKAKGKNNIWGYTESFNFSVREAWYKTWVFRMLVALFFVASTYMFYLIRIRNIKAQKDRLELQVRERTREIHEQKDEIEAQRNRIQWQLEEIENQRDHILEQRDLVLKQKQAMTDSITYAQKIQSAILPLPTAIKDFFSEYFIIFQPRDIVSGDFYWFKETEDSIIIVGADCTGHGVPGAFMSMLGVTLLNEELRGNRQYTPSEMLGLLRAKVKETLAQEDSLEEQKDGMEMAFVLIDKEKRLLQYAGANQPLYLIRKKGPTTGIDPEDHLSIENNDYKLFQFKGDKQPIGSYWEETEFTNHEIDLRQGDTFYIFSDGILDQYGGKKRKKYKAVNFRKLLLSIQHESMQEQKDIIKNTFDTWRGKYEQIDDVSVIGVRI
jgi:serine phosphatase RsbU (regulator of sigma subunit)